VGEAKLASYIHAVILFILSFVKALTSEIIPMDSGSGIEVDVHVLNPPPLLKRQLLLEGISSRL
jgi:hypothetical protein